VALHGGDVSVFSAGLGKGAEFVVQLPVADASAAGGDAEVDAMPARARSVLVVDDNRDAADTMSMLLKALGYRTRTAYDARSALEMLQTSRPDVAILDIGLPDMDGRKLARAIRTQYGDAVALIALTGYGQEQDRDATLDAGFRDHLTKPLSSDALIAALQRVSEDGLNGA